MQVSGRYSEAPFHALVEPMHEVSMAVLKSNQTLAAALAEVLSERCSLASLERVEEQLKVVERDRMALWRERVEVRLSCREPAS